jgi:hypothetical protein
MWGPEEIAEHLGSASLRELRDEGHSKGESRGFSVRVPPPAALALIAQRRAASSASAARRSCARL